MKENSIEKDIEQVKNSLKELETEKDDIQLWCIKSELEMSINCILSEYKRLQKENENFKKVLPLRVEVKPELFDYQDALKGILDEWSKAYQEERDKNFDLIMKIKNDYISIQEVKDKIDKIKNEELGYSEDEWYIENEIKGYAIDKLKEIVEEGGSND